jgi:trehalose 6-phosphate phosphatase
MRAATRPAAIPRATRTGGRISESRWCLFLDVDGTLLEMAATPDGVRVEPSLNALLARVSSRLQGALALVSGRPVADIDRLFAPERWPAAGVHGLERRDATGHWHAHPPVDVAKIDRARMQLHRLSASLPGTIVEDKGPSVALHYRQAPQHEELARRGARAIAREAGDDFHLLEGRKVLELRPDGADKADAVRAFLGEPPFVHSRPIFVGDDLTDQAALAEVERAGGLSVAVGDRVQGMVRVSGPREVRAFLEGLATTGNPAECA